MLNVAGSGPFGCTLKELRELMELRGHDACERIRQEYGTVNEICRRLNTSATDGRFDLSRTVKAALLYDIYIYIYIYINVCDESFCPCS
jgi:hypothetical protein